MLSSVPTVPFLRNAVASLRWFGNGGRACLKLYGANTLIHRAHHPF